ncbi:hypothetical protein DPEC_G00074540 [Dallia pectoralis]|uniref:Uncharacterized protein n=1 Tax=Dallia pectoralis TaxID=75939 RepID=A0ACC2H3H4_DALPE|nr:hypothetical protein DPEC_G00074540 [Dallia pectoralis]
MHVDRPSLMFFYQPVWELNRQPCEGLVLRQLLTTSCLAHRIRGNHFLCEVCQGPNYRPSEPRPRPNENSGRNPRSPLPSASASAPWIPFHRLASPPCRRVFKLPVINVGSELGDRDGFQMEIHL